MGLEYFLNHPNVLTSADKKRMKLKLPVHPDNVEILKPYLSPHKTNDGFYTTIQTNIKNIHKIIALEGPIFRSAPQLVHMSLAIEGLKRGYLFADPITFAEEFGSTDTSADVRKKIYTNWTNVIKNSDVTLALTEYGKGYDPGVVTGSIIQLNEGKPVLGLSLSNNNEDIFSNTIEHCYLSPEEVTSLIKGHKAVLDKIISQVIHKSSYGADKSFQEIKGAYKKEYDILIAHEKNIEGIINAENVREKLNKSGRKPVLLGEITKDFTHLYDLYDLARYISKSIRVVVLGDDSSEPGVIGSSALQISKILNTHVSMLRGDFRILTGEGEGAGFKQPSKGLYGASNLMLEFLLPNGIYTKIDSLVEDLRISRKS